MEDGYACPVCGGWFKKDENHFHEQPLAPLPCCEHDYIPYPFDYTSTNATPKMLI